MPTAVAAPWQSCPDHPLVGMETAAPGPGHAMSLPETPSETFITSATVVLDKPKSDFWATWASRTALGGENRKRVICARLQAAYGVGRLPPIDDVNVTETFLPVAVGFGDLEVPLHVDGTDEVVRRSRRRIPGDDDLASFFTL